jgi:hypothetical protein
MTLKRPYKITLLGKVLLKTYMPASEKGQGATEASSK